MADPIFNVGDRARLVDDIFEPACGDHPAFFLGQRGEVVVIREVRPNGHLPYLVEGSTRPGERWFAGYCDLEIAP